MHFYVAKIERKRSDLMQKNINIKKSGSHLRRGGSVQRTLCSRQPEYPGTNWQDTIFQACYGFELWKYLLLLVLILFAIEIIIIKSEEKKA